MSEIHTHPDSKSCQTAVDESWQRLWLENAGWVRTVVASRMRWSCVDEVVQNVAIKAWQNQHQLTSGDKLGPWLYRITLQQVALFFRESGRRHQRFASDLDTEDLPSRQTADPFEWLTKKEIYQNVCDGLDRLEAEEREIFLLKHKEGWTYQQLADHLGLSVDKVIYRLRKARNKLRQMLAPRKGENDE